MPMEQRSQYVSFGLTEYHVVRHIVPSLNLASDSVANKRYFLAFFLFSA